MEESKQEASTYPYPLRSSELASGENFFDEVEPIVLSPQERQKLLKLDQKLFERIEPLKKLTPETHVVYPDFFLTDQGWRLFQLAYLDPDLKERVGVSAEKEGTSLETEKDKKKFFNKVSDRLIKASANEEDFERYKKEKGVETKKVERPLTQGEATALFFNLENLAAVPTQIRGRINKASYDHARDQFLDEFQSQDGKIEEIANPYRASRIVDAGKLIEKVSGYRELKREVRELTRESRKEEGSFSEARVALGQIYLRYLNVLIAQNYDYGRILATQPSLSPEEEQAFSLVKGTKGRFAGEQASRTMERIDHFLNGVGLRIGEDGLFETIPDNLSQFIKDRAGVTEVPETADYRKYNAVKVNAEQAKELAEAIFRAYGFDDHEWSVYISPTHKGFSVGYRNKGEIIKEVNIPEKLNRGLVSTLAVLAHEVEGHVLRFDNREQGIGGLSLLEEFSMGRTGILSEAGAMWIEDQTKRQLVGMPRFAKPFYGLMLLEKQGGGSFKDCFRAYLDAYTEINRQDLDELMKDERKGQGIFKRAFSSALRIFRNQTPLDDESGFLPASSQLNYIEQELVAQTLFENGLGKILFLGGIDLYSLRDLQKLGFLDWEKVQEPKFAAAKEIWPVIKGALDQGKNLQEAIDAL